MTARFEVVHTGPYRFHARFVAGNGEIVWTTESYHRARAAVEAVWLLREQFASAEQGVRIPVIEEPTNRRSTTSE